MAEKLRGGPCGDCGNMASTGDFYGIVLGTYPGGTQRVTSVTLRGTQAKWQCVIHSMYTTVSKLQTQWGITLLEKLGPPCWNRPIYGSNGRLLASVCLHTCSSTPLRARAVDTGVFNVQ